MRGLEFETFEFFSSIFLYSQRFKRRRRACQACRHTLRICTELENAMATQSGWALDHCRLLTPRRRGRPRWGQATRPEAGTGTQVPDQAWASSSAVQMRHEEEAHASWLTEAWCLWSSATGRVGNLMSKMMTLDESMSTVAM